MEKELRDEIDMCMYLGNKYVTNAQMLWYIFHRLFHCQIDDDETFSFHFDYDWYHEKYTGPDTKAEIEAICRRAQEQSTNIRVLNAAFEELFGADIDDILSINYCDGYDDDNPWFDTEYTK